MNFFADNCVITSNKIFLYHPTEQAWNWTTCKNVSLGKKYTSIVNDVQSEQSHL